MGTRSHRDGFLYSPSDYLPELLCSFLYVVEFYAQGYKFRGALAPLVTTGEMIVRF